MFPPNFLVVERIRCRQEIGSKKRLLEQLSELLASHAPGLSPKLVFDRLLDRERLGTTGLGMGIALPHARMGEVQHPVGALIHLNSGVDFDAIDKQPVDLAFGLVVPEGAREEHLQLLARLAALFSQPQFCAELRQAKSADEILRLMEGWEQVLANV
jgi:PTS system nitrogen regulatory IIA component